jgi:hypothetical protein
LITGWEFEPHETFLKEVRKEVVVGRGRHVKSAKMRGEHLGFKEELEISVLLIGNGIEGYNTS